MTRDEMRNQARAVLLNDTDRFWTRDEVLATSNRFLGAFGEEHKVEMPAVEQALMDLVIQDDVADATEDGRVRMNLAKFSRWAEEQPSASAD